VFTWRLFTRQCVMGTFEGVGLGAERASLCMTDCLMGI